MSKPSEDSLVFASIVLIELAESRPGHEGDILREVAEYLLRLSTMKAVPVQNASTALNNGGRAP